MIRIQTRKWGCAIHIFSNIQVTPPDDMRQIATNRSRANKLAHARIKDTRTLN